MPRSEKDIEADVIRVLTAVGYRVTKTSQHGKPRGMTEGVPDLYAMHPGVPYSATQGPPHAIWVEVKSAAGRLRDSQVRWHRDAAACGVTVIVARSAADLVAPLQALGIPIR